MALRRVPMKRSHRRKRRNIAPGGDEQRNDRYPDQNHAHHGEKNHDGEDADDQHEQGDTERAEPCDVDAMCRVRRR